MIKLTYTDEMKKQDKLWSESNEDLDVMEKLYREIEEEAKQKGFNGIAYIYDGESEKLCTIYESKEQEELARLGKVEVEDFGYCKPLILYLETLLNKTRD